jgi:xanthine/CO dehydrogenase XdhC/CoxF family maturation factor
MTDQEIFQTLSDLRRRGKAACLATIVDTVGSTPRDPGAKMIVCADGTMFGSVGGGCGEGQVKSASLRCLLSTGKPELVEVDLTDELGTKGGDVCGGKMRIFVEPVSGEFPPR